MSEINKVNFDLAMKINNKMSETTIETPPRWFNQDYRYNSDYFRIKKIGFND